VLEIKVISLDKGVIYKRLIPREAETTDRSSSKWSKWNPRAKQGFGWGKCIVCVWHDIL